MLKACSVPLCTRLTALFNSSFSSGKVPSAWKLSRVTPIFKKGDSNQVENYIPISLLSLVGKVQDRLVHCTLLDHLLGRKAISTSQFGFRLGGSTQGVLISMIQSWHVNMEADQNTICIFLDLAKAFDYVSHFIVIDALFRAGVSDPLLSWFCDYLTSRSQFVVLEGSASSPCEVTSGVPQISILGPLLFIFNGIFHLPLSSESNLTDFADDVTYSRSYSGLADEPDVAEELATIANWLTSRGFRLNTRKVKAMIVSCKKTPPTISLQLQGEHIQVVNSFRLLASPSPTTSPGKSTSPG